MICSIILREEKRGIYTEIICKKRREVEICNTVIKEQEGRGYIKCSFERRGGQGRYTVQKH